MHYIYNRNSLTALQGKKKEDYHQIQSISTFKGIGIWNLGTAKEKKIITL